MPDLPLVAESESLSATDIVVWMARLDDLIHGHLTWLTELDTAIGDSDHGFNLAKGMTALDRALQEAASDDAGKVLQVIGSTFASTGGASGALYGSMFIEMSRTVGCTTTITPKLLVSALYSGLDAVTSLGSAALEDKTMVDVLHPAISAIHTSLASHNPLQEALAAGAQAAVAARDNTRPLLARKGRASYLGKRSVGHIDPGAASAALIFAALAHQNLPSLHTPINTGALMSTTRRQLVNQPDDVIAEALDGLQRTYPNLLTFDSTHNVISRATPATGKVGLVSGGGSGHEPLHAGFVGTGMLDAAVCGAVFASPTSDQVLAGTRTADSGAGVVHIVKNYTGDVLNFEIAADLVSDDGIAMEAVVVDDDLASDGAGSGPGRRGTAAVVTVEKICGALAEAGADLKTVAARGRDVVSRSRSLALALDACAHPGDSRAAFELEAHEVEFGVGIHGERGTSRIPFASADELTEQLVSPLVDSLQIARGQQVIAIVNGLGSAYPLELSIVARQMHRLLNDRGISVARSLAGSYVTSLDMHGVSITLTIADDELLKAWDAPVRTLALTW